MCTSLFRIHLPYSFFHGVSNLKYQNKTIFIKEYFSQCGMNAIADTRRQELYESVSYKCMIPSIYIKTILYKILMCLYLAAKYINFKCKTHMFYHIPYTVIIFSSYRFTPVIISFNLLIATRRNYLTKLSFK